MWCGCRPIRGRCGTTADGGLPRRPPAAHCLRALDPSKPPPPPQGPARPSQRESGRTACARARPSTKTTMRPGRAPPARSGSVPWGGGVRASCMRAAGGCRGDLLPLRGGLPTDRVRGRGCGQDTAQGQCPSRGRWGVPVEMRAQGPGRAAPWEPHVLRCYCLPPFPNTLVQGGGGAVTVCGGGGVLGARGGGADPPGPEFGGHPPQQPLHSPVSGGGGGLRGPGIGGRPPPSQQHCAGAGFGGTPSLWGPLPGHQKRGQPPPPLGIGEPRRKGARQQATALRRFVSGHVHRRLSL